MWVYFALNQSNFICKNWSWLH